MPSSAARRNAKASTAPARWRWRNRCWNGRFSSRSRPATCPPLPRRLATMRRPPSPPAAVVFDCDGLLLDTESAWSRGEAVLYRRHGVRFTLEHKRELLGTAGTRAREIIERHLGLPGQGEELAAELLETVMAQGGRSGPAN